MAIDHTRHLGIFSAYSLSITLIGAGGIGALTAVVLGKMGVSNLTIYDSDTVDDVNLATQFYLVEDLKRYKAYALEFIVKQFTDDTEVNSWVSRITSKTNPDMITNPIVISAVDSINARKEIWEVVKKTHALWYLDSRMSAESFQMYCVDMGDWLWYNNILIDQYEEQVPDEPCTSKATIYTAAIAAGHIGSIVKDIAVGKAPPKFLLHNVPEHLLFTP